MGISDSQELQGNADTRVRVLIYINWLYFVISSLKHCHPELVEGSFGVRLPNDYT